jgi:hypothetical protein
MEEPKWKIYGEFLTELKEMALKNKTPEIKPHLFYEAIIMMVDEILYLRAENERLRDAK